MAASTREADGKQCATPNRDVDGKQCALRCCGGPILAADDGVRVSTPLSRLKRVPGGAAGRAALAVDWRMGAPRAYFHATCWGPLLASAGLAAEAPTFAAGGGFNAFPTVS